MNIVNKIIKQDDGCSMSFYKVELSEYYFHKTYKTIVLVIYEQYELITIAIERNNEIFLNPSLHQFVINKGDYAIILGN
jgi:K+/H+ antiporter YhaU regulatory subunit KhtT